MKKIILILMLAVTLLPNLIKAQNADPLPKASYQTTETILRAIVENTLKALRVKIVAGEIALDSAAFAQLELLVQKHYATYERQDSIKEKLIELKAKLTSTSPGYFTPYKPFYSYKDSLVNKDTVVYTPNHEYSILYVKINNRSTTTLDSVAIENYSENKGTWTQYAVGWYDETTNIPEVNNAQVVITYGTAGIEKTYRCSKLRPYKIRVRTLSTRARTLDVTFEAVNP